MKYTVYDRLLKREVGQHRKKYSDIRSIYGDRQWVQDLDIVNELEGHNGCVNALCWSRSGRLLASGSDDHRINIHCYHPESSTSQFSLTTSIMTGHHLNIFSVKFMPYSNDRTIVSATDDVRIFDIEYSGHSALDSGNRSQARRRRVGIQGAPDGLTLTEGDTNAKAFRCHSDTVKRIVTEDNPFYFLTCSEDGDVRQWDIRQPSKTYPPPKDSLMPSWAANPSASDNIPPPLISYSRYGLDLNTVSCSPSQPHYIALGGAHLHCFLHDRRMLGRDKNRERGGVLSSPGPWGELDNELLGKATQCVKKFAPRGQKRMKRNDSGHITACKISDYNPNELVVSWSSDYIYSFDINRSPDASEEIVSSNVSKGNSGRRVKDKSRKRKRPKSRRVSQEAAERAGSRQRTASSDEGLALRVTYGNGQSEEIRIEPPQTPLSQTEVAALQETDHYRIARTAVKIQRRMFDFGELGDTGLKLAYTSILGFAASILPEMDDISRSWRYPVDPSPVDVAVQNKLRDTRASCRRFVQAAGTLSRVLGGQLLTGGTSDALIAQYFVSIQFAPSERSLPRHEQFGYDFLKAILLWLDSGPGAVVEGFTSRSSNPRLPLTPDADIDSIDEALIPYLLQLAGDDPIVNVDVSRFETDDTRILYSSEKAAVIAFSRAIRVPFADLTGAIVPTTGDRSVQYEVQDRREAIRVWASRIGRGVLLNASKDVRFSIVDRAFGGRGVADPSARAEEDAFRERQDDIDPLEEDQPVVAAEVISGASGSQASEDADEGTSLLTSGEASQRRSGASGVEAAEDEDEEEEQNDGENDDDSDGDIDSSEEENDSDDEEGGLQRTRSGRMLWRSEFGRSRQRERVELDVPCAPHTRVYTGHCNVRTVKDVNYFGLQDEYVVSGSDSGHVFIWDRKSAQLLNILEGDGEVVNVVQGHPYEPTMAVSGIDHTIKIFSPDAQEQRNARKGIGVQTADPGRSSLGYGRRRRAQRAAEPEQPRDPTFSDSDEEIAPNGLRSRRRMHQQYQITSQNDMNRKGAGDDFFISRAVFAQLARLHAQHHAGNGTGGDGDGGGDDDEEGDGPIVITEENCSVM